MIVNTPYNVNQALALGLKMMRDETVTAVEDTRNGRVISAVVPVTTVTLNPLERVLFSPLRNANPFFHLFESLWMLSGRNDLPWLAQFNKRMVEYSDDGGATQPGAYGFRWREHFGYDQLDAVVEELTARPNSRRAVLGMWDPWGVHQMPDGSYAMRGDLLGAGSSKDVPCNTHIYFRVVNGALDMTVCCRSNDLWWGAHGANAVHFSILLEYMAARLNLRVGKMTQISNNYHIYTDVVKSISANVSSAIEHDYYKRGITNGLVNPTQIFHHNTMDIFESELPVFMEYADPTINPVRTPYTHRVDRLREPPKFAHWFLSNVAMPMLRAWDAQKAGDWQLAFDRAARVGRWEGKNGGADPHSDWQRASLEWLQRKQKRIMGG